MAPLYQTAFRDAIGRRNAMLSAIEPRERRDEAVRQPDVVHGLDRRDARSSRQRRYRFGHRADVAPQGLSVTPIRTDGSLAVRMGG